MAEQINELLDDMLQCSLCLEELTGPRLLPCHHSYCLGCLETYVRSKDTKDKVCPICRAEFLVPTGGVAEFAQNFLVNQIKEARAKIKKQTSEDDSVCTEKNEDGSERQCSIDDCGQKAAIFCRDGCKYLCSACAKAHAKMPSSKRHRSVTSEEADNIKEDGVETALSRCTRHSHQYLDLYCKDCRMITCATCFVLDHREHKCCEIGTFMENIKGELKLILADADQCLQAVRQSRQDLQNQMDHQIEQDGSKMKQKMAIAFHAMHKQLDEEEERVMGEIEGAVATAEKAVASECYSQEMLEANLESVRFSIEKLLLKGTAQEYAASIASLKERVPKPSSLQLQKFNWLVHERWVNWKVPIGEASIHQLRETIGKSKLLCISEKDKNGVCGMVSVGKYLLVLFRYGNICVCSTPSGVIKEIHPFASGGLYSSLAIVYLNGRSYVTTLALEHNLCIKREVVAQRDEVVFGGLWQYQLSYSASNMTSDNQGNVLITDPIQRAVHFHNGATLQEVRCISMCEEICPHVVYPQTDGFVVIDFSNRQLVWVSPSTGKKIREVTTPSGPMDIQITSCGDIILASEDGLYIVRNSGETEEILRTGVDGMFQPHRVCLDQHSGRLYVGHYTSIKRTATCVSYLDYHPCLVTVMTLKADIPGVTN